MASKPTNVPPLAFQPTPAVYPSDIEDELEEVDQLDSDTEPEDPLDPTKPQTSKNGSSKPGERIPGHTLLSATRIENMITSEGVTGNLALSKEGLFVLSIATEEFIKRLVQAGHREASVQRKSMISYGEMAMTARQYQEFMFLHDTIPAPVTLADALKLRENKERELLEENPATSSGLFPSAGPAQGYDWMVTGSSEMMPGSSKSIKRSRPSNGKDRVNGSSSTNHKRPSKKINHDIHVPNDPSVLSHSVEWVGNAYPPHPEIPTIHSPPRNGISPAASSIPPPPNMNGYPPRQSHSPQEDISDQESYPPPSVYPESHSQSITPPYPPQEDPAWSGQFTGPASGFLQPTPAPFGHSQNPGRTIYSTSHRPD